MNEDHRENLLDEISAQIPAADFEAEYFPGGLSRISIDLTTEMVEQIEAVAKEQGWPRGEAFVALLSLGLGAFLEEKARALIEQDDALARDELDLLVRRMRQMEMQYAVMKRRVWDFLKAYQSACLTDGALRTQVMGLTALVGSLRAERDALRRQVAALEGAARSQLSPTSCEETEPPVAPPSREPWWRRWVRR